MSSPTSGIVSHPPTPLARVCYVAATVMGIAGIALFATAPDRGWWDVVMMVLFGLLTAMAAASLVPRLRHRQLVGTKPEVEGPTAMNLAGLNMMNLGNGLNQHVDAWWPLLFIVGALGLVFGGLALRARTR